MILTTPGALRVKFFDFIFGETEGFVCICTQIPHKRSSFKQEFFKWPDERPQLNEFIEEKMGKQHVWFCVNLLRKAERKKEYCLPTNLVWADLDLQRPQEIDPPPQVTIESSPGRYQAIWRLDTEVDPYVAENYSKRIAYKYRQGGADPSGWDLTQLLRVPFTYNHKYDNTPKVDLLTSAEILLPVGVFESVEAVPLLPEDEYLEDGMPDVGDIPPADGVIYKYMHNLKGTIFAQLYGDEPETTADWSKRMWRLILINLEAGMSAVECFAVVLEAKCNKYERDRRPIRYLWREVQKADQRYKRLNTMLGEFKPTIMPVLVDPDKVEDAGFINDYRAWASSATDACVDYHELSAAILMSSILAQSLKLHTSYGEMIPNLWGLILGDSTLTRKTTAMRMAMDIIGDIDRDMVLATDGSAEGLLTGLAERPYKTSIFYKDEVAGFLDSINRKDYLAGMTETMTQLYDVPQFYTRRLRKDTINIISPVFIFFGGGIRDKTYSLVNDSHVLSGFLPRFLVVSGDADLAQIRRTGPGTNGSISGREKVLQKVADLYETYYRHESVEILGQKTSVASTTEVKLSDKAWVKYGEIEFQMVEEASKSPVSTLMLPTFERLSRSLLKLSMLIAATRQTPNKDNCIIVDVRDVLQSAKYIQKWGAHSIDLIQNCGRTTAQRMIDKVHNLVVKNPGISRGKIMQSYHLAKREMTEIEGTLEDRGQITVTREGKGIRYHAI